MIIENRTTANGDVLWIKAEVPVVGLIALTGFIDSTQGESVARYFYKEFRYSTNGVSYSDWRELTLENIRAVVINSTDTFFIEYKYTATGLDPDLAFWNIETQGVYTDPGEYGYFNKSIFKDYFNVLDLGVLGWALNVLEKVYRGNLLPQYIERSSGTLDDKDFLDFWFSVTLFYSFFVYYARVFETFQLHRNLLEDFIIQRGLLFCNNTDYTDLLHLSRNFYDEMRQRGTVQIIKRKNSDSDFIDESISTSVSVSETVDNLKPVDGELLRLICYDISKDEFLFNFRERHLVGWNVGNSSPEYRDLYDHINTNKAYEQDEDFKLLSKYPLVNPGNLSIVQDSGKSVLKIEGVNSGIGGVLNLDKAIIIDPNLNYQITFFAKGNAGITFGVIALDENDGVIDLYDIDEAPTNYFFEDETLNQSDKYYSIRGFIFRKSKHYGSSPLESTLNIGFGKHLRFQENVLKIIPVVLGTGGVLHIWDFKIWPLSTDYGTGFIQPYNFIDLFLKNNNGKYSEKEIERLIRHYLLPYNTTFKTTFIAERREVDYIYPLTIQTIQIIDVSTYGGADGSIDIEVEGGKAPYTYLWSNGHTGEDLKDIPTGIPSGFYSVIVTDDEGRTAAKSFEIKQPQPQALSITYTKIDASIYGASNGSIDITVSGGVMPYTYMWSNGAVTEDLVNIPAGTYSVTVFDSVGQSKSITIEVTQPAEVIPALLVSLVSKTNVTTVGGSDGAIDILISGGVLPYDITWSNGAKTEDLVNIPAGTYHVTVVDGAGQIGQINNIQVTQPQLNTMEEDLTAIFYLDANVFFVAGRNGGIYKTTDGGNIYKTLRTRFQGEFTQYIHNMHWVDDQIGFVTQPELYRILKTVDGGDTWSSISFGTNKAYSVHAIDANEVYVAAAGPVLYKSTNGGSNFVSNPFGTAYNNVTNLHLVDRNHIYLADGTFWEIDGESNLSTNYIDVPIRDIYMYDNENGVGLASNGIYIKVDDGVWVLSPNSPVTAGARRIDGNVAIAAIIGSVQHPTNPYELMGQSNNRGATWFSFEYKNFSDFSNNRRYNDLRVIDSAGNALWVGNAGIVYRKNGTDVVKISPTPNNLITKG